MHRWLKLKRKGVRAPHVVISEAKRAKCPLPDALAMLEQETGIPQRNIFGCDYGANTGVPYCNQKVTADRVEMLLRSSYSNGIGWTQVTYKPLIPSELKDQMHRPKYQCRVGFEILAGLIRQYGQQGGHQRYNGSGAAAEAYGRRAVELARKWKAILD